MDPEPKSIADFVQRVAPELGPDLQATWGQGFWRWCGITSLLYCRPCCFETPDQQVHFIWDSPNLTVRLSVDPDGKIEGLATSRELG